jgi:hypothetical protein
MDDYDKCMAKGHEIAEKIRQRQESESDSEYGMEGIEGGSSIAIAVEDQEMVGAETSGDNEAQAPVFSPRRTRSGRVIK